MMKKMSGKEYYELCIQRAIKWNHGSIPESNIRENFLYNGLCEEGVIVTVSSKEIKLLEPWHQVCCRCQNLCKKAFTEWSGMLPDSEYCDRFLLITD